MPPRVVNGKTYYIPDEWDASKVQGPEGAFGEFPPFDPSLAGQESASGLDYEFPEEKTDYEFAPEPTDYEFPVPAESNVPKQEEQVLPNWYKPIGNETVPALAQPAPTRPPPVDQAIPGAPQPGQPAPVQAPVQPAPQPVAPSDAVSGAAPQGISAGKPIQPYEPAPVNPYEAMARDYADRVLPRTRDELVQDQIDIYDTATTEGLGLLKGDEQITREFGEKQAAANKKIIAQQNSKQEIRNQLAGQVQQIMQESDAERAKADQEIEEFRREAKIRPNRIWEDSSFLGKAGQLLAVAFGGLGRGATGGYNSALQILQRRINEDIDAQEKNIAEQRADLLDKRNQIELLRRDRVAWRQLQASMRFETVADNIDGLNMYIQSQAQLAENQRNAQQSRKQALDLYTQGRQGVHNALTDEANRRAKEAAARAAAAAKASENAFKLAERKAKLRGLELENAKKEKELTGGETEPSDLFAPVKEGAEYGNLANLSEPDKRQLTDDLASSVSSARAFKQHAYWLGNLSRLSPNQRLMAKHSLYNLVIKQAAGKELSPLGDRDVDMLIKKAGGDPTKLFRLADDATLEKIAKMNAKEIEDGINVKLQAKNVRNTKVRIGEPRPDLLPEEEPELKSASEYAAEGQAIINKIEGRQPKNVQAGSVTVSPTEAPKGQVSPIPANPTETGPSDADRAEQYKDLGTTVRTLMSTYNSSPWSAGVITDVVKQLPKDFKVSLLVDNKGRIYTGKAESAQTTPLQLQEFNADQLKQMFKDKTKLKDVFLTPDQLKREEAVRQIEGGGFKNTLTSQSPILR